MTTELTGTVRFIQHHLPAIQAGEYRLTGRTRLQNTSASGHSFDDTIAHHRRFAVPGNRFRLNPDDLHSVYPPSNAEGEFANTLPHVVFRNRTLPWQYSPSRELHETGQAGNQAGWLALLLIDQDADANQISLRSGVLRDALAPTADNGGALPAGYVSYPGLHTLEYGESYDDACDLLDIDINLFTAIAPARAELQWLAHARAVDHNKKTDLSTAARASAIQDYSIVIGNRLPARNAASTVHLVALQEFAELLPDAAGNPSPELPAGTTHIRLISLYHWDFRVQTREHSFTGLLETVHNDVLRLPVGESPDTTPVDQTLGLGYVPLNHDLRGGDATVSFYRGPLIPYKSTRFLQAPFRNSDQLLRYDPDTGIYDVSCATAFELGRLLAIENRDYATSLYHWQRAFRLQSIARLERNEIFTNLNDTLQADPIIIRQPQAMLRSTERYMASKIQTELVYEPPPPDDGSEEPPPPDGGGGGDGGDGGGEPPAPDPVRVFFEQLQIAIQVITTLLRKFLEFFRR